MLPNKNLQASIGGGLAVDDCVVHKTFTSVKLDGSFSRFLVNLYGQGNCECKGDCNEKSGSDQFMSTDKKREKKN